MMLTIAPCASGGNWRANSCASTKGARRLTAMWRSHDEREALAQSSLSKIEARAFDDRIARDAKSGKLGKLKAEARASHPGAAVRPRTAAALRVEAHHSSRIRVVGAEAAHHGRVR